jgi:hypothetical protein
MTREIDNYFLQQPDPVKKLNHPALIVQKRARMKIMLFDPEKDIPVKLHCCTSMNCSKDL